MDGASRTAASLVTSDVYDTSRRCGFVMALSIVVDAERKPKFLPPLEIAATECATERPYTLPENVRGHPFEYPRSATAAAYCTSALSEAVRWFSDRPLDSDEGAYGDTLICVRVEENEIARFEWIELIGAHHNP